MNLSIPRRSRALALTAVLLITALLSALLVTFSTSTQSAEAHTPRHQATCTGLSVSATAYGANANNRVTVVIDGATVVDRTFGASYQGTFPWSQTEDHSWSVTIDQGDGDQYDYFREGVQTACQSQTPTSVGAEPTFQDVCGPDYSLTVPADEPGYRFTRDESGVQGGAGTITVTATLEAGYVWQDRTTAPRTWTFRATDEPCDVVVDVPAQPALQDVCGPEFGAPELPSNEAYTWSVDDAGVTEGAGTVVITATLNPGYVWAGGGTDTQSFSYDVTNEPCDVPTTVDGSPSVLDQCGVAYELQVPETSDADGYAFTVDETGVVDGAGTVVVTATLADGYTWEDGTTEARTWEFPVTSEPCDTPVVGIALADVGVTPATCSTPGTAEGTTLENADWTTADVPAAGGVATFVATAHVGSSFEAGLPGVSTDRTTRTFTVDVPAAGGELCSVAPPPIEPPTQDTPPTPPAQATPPTLPRTGFDISSILVLGTLLALAGATLVARRIRVEG